MSKKIVKLNSKQFTFIGNFVLMHKTTLHDYVKKKLIIGKTYKLYFDNSLEARDHGFTIAIFNGIKYIVNMDDSVYNEINSEFNRVP